MALKMSTSLAGKAAEQRALAARICGCLLVVLALTPRPASARTWRVALDGSGAATTVQRGIELATTGDTVLVAPGTYNEDIDFLGKGVVLKSESGPEVTILDGAGQDSSIVILRNAEPPGTELAGFTLQNGRGSPYGGSTQGGALWCSRGSVYIRDSIFRSNASTWGGAVSIRRDGKCDPGPAPSVTIDHCTFTENSTVFPGSGGGIGASGFLATLMVANCMFTGNSSYFDGAGMSAWLNSGNLTVVGCEFREGIAGAQGGGVWVYADPPARLTVTISHNLIAGNRANGIDSAPRFAGGLMVYGFTGVVDHNTIVHNVSAPGGSCSGGGFVVGQTDDLIIDHNLFAYNSDCGLVCRNNPYVLFGPNLFWENPPDNFPVGDNECRSAWADKAFIADPQFCTSGPNPYTLASTSPAITATGTMGAFSTPGCDGTPVVSTTWGGIKAMYGN